MVLTIDLAPSVAIAIAVAITIVSLAAAFVATSR